MDWVSKLKEKGIEVTEETVALGTLHTDPRNANVHPEHQIEQLKKSLEFFGQPERLIVGPDGRIVGGNGRFEAMKRLDWPSVRITRVNADDSFLDALGLALNKVAEGSYLDNDIVAEILSDIATTDNDDMEAVLATGFSESEIADILDLDDDDYFDVDDDIDDEEEEEVPTKKPTASADGFSSFEIVMTHDSKVELVDTLDSIRKNTGGNLEQALMTLVKTYKKDGK